MSELGWGEIRAGAATLTTPGSKPAHWHTDMYAMFDGVQISNLIDLCCKANQAFQTNVPILVGIILFLITLGGLYTARH